MRIVVPDPAVGERWAYRANSKDPLVEVAVLRLGSKAPRRVLVRWVDDEFEGKQDWVPPARLKAKWEDVEEFRARERRWEAVRAPSAGCTEAMSSAVSLVFDILIDEKLASLGYNADDGVVRIHDVAGLTDAIDESPAWLRDATSFEEDGDLVSPMPIAVSIARRAVERDPHRVLRCVEHKEADTRRDAIHG